MSITKIIKLLSSMPGQHVICFLIQNFMGKPELYVMWFSMVELFTHQAILICNPNTYITESAKNKLCIYSLLFCISIKMVYNMSIIDTYIISTLMLKITEKVLLPLILKLLGVAI